MQFIQFQSQDPNTMNIPADGSFNVFVDQTDNNLKIKDSTGEVYGGSGGGYSETTYSELVNAITTSALTEGSFYLITDFRTCYDQPDFDYDNNPITSGNYKQAAVEPIIVFATSVSTISTEAFQPLYPNDKIKYDWTYTTTEVTNSEAYGRITERIDEFNNRTDYDHRTILFKRYRLYTHRETLRLNGVIEILNDGVVNGVNTSFTTLTVGDVIYTPNLSPSYYEIVEITDDTTMTVSGDTISAGSGLEVYLTVEETDGEGKYFSYKRTNVKTEDFIEYTTFGNALFESYAINNYVGNYANTNQEVFLLANNVFLEGQYESNKFGDYCYNNTFGTDNSNNIWGDYCFNNVSTNDIDGNIIGHYFEANLINVNLVENRIGNSFYSNKLLAENNDDFQSNIIGDGFNNNTIYSSFYNNTISVAFEYNMIGDYGNLSNLSFYRNNIGNNFNNNTVKQEFQNNRISTNFQNNEIYGRFIGNTILNGFNNNQIGNYFSVNEIGNGFNGNIVNDDFNNNTTLYQFSNNLISNDFMYNSIGNYFTNNLPSNRNLFGWDDLGTVSVRNYDVFIEAFGGGALGERILGKELVMRVVSTSQYFKIKFTQWTQNSNGGGFQYERQEIDSNGDNIGDLVIFTKTNYGSEVDVVVEGVVEITRGNNQGIYNAVTESSWNNSVSPDDTEWNSIYTEPNNGERFGYNKIGNNFQGNVINSDFGYGGGDPYGNIINDNFQNNIIGQFMYNNVIGNNFRYNEIGNNFENNTIKNYFLYNTIYDGFESNQIGDYFGNDGSAGGTPIKNIIFNDFKYNKIGNFFGNDGNFPSGDNGTYGDGGNVINDGFQFNVIGDNFIFNAIDLDFRNNKIGDNFWFNTFGQNTTDNTIGNFFVGNTGIGGFGEPIGDNFISNNLSNYSGFNEIGSDFQYNKIGNFFGNAGTSNIIAIGFKNNSIGNYFGDAGSHTNGGNEINYEFYDNLIGNKFYGNLVYAEFFRNDIGNEFFGNELNGADGNVFHNNEIGNRFNDNTTGGQFYGNIIGGGFNGNTIGSNFYTNEIGFGFNNNVVGIEFYENVIEYYFNNNTIGDSFARNNITSNFNANVVLDAFQSNNIKCGVSGTNFSTATNVYGAWDCEIFTRKDGVRRLSYYDDMDGFVITNIDS